MKRIHRTLSLAAVTPAAGALPAAAQDQFGWSVSEGLFVLRPGRRELIP